MTSLADLYPQLIAPFPAQLVELKPAAVAKDKPSALALCYVDARDYLDRLDTVIGPDNWQVAYKPVGDRALICRLQALGIVREEIGECSDPNDPNFWTVASAQAFKRACSAFGLGRYLYQLPKVWADYDKERKTFVNPSATVARIYREAGIK